MEQASTHGEWQRWLDEHAPKFLLFARQKARSEADAHDLVQDAVVESLRRKRDGGPPELALVFATIRRRAVDQARREERRANRELAVAELRTETWFDTTVEQNEISQVIGKAMSQLPEAQREIVTLKVWGGLTFAEIADVLGVPANTAASRYRYALAELRKLMKGVLA